MNLLFHFLTTCHPSRDEKSLSGFANPDRAYPMANTLTGLSTLSGEVITGRRSEIPQPGATPREKDDMTDGSLKGFNQLKRILEKAYQPYRLVGYIIRLCLGALPQVLEWEPFRLKDWNLAEYFSRLQIPPAILSGGYFMTSKRFRKTFL